MRGEGRRRSPSIPCSSSVLRQRELMNATRPSAATVGDSVSGPGPAVEAHRSARRGRKQPDVGRAAAVRRMDEPEAVGREHRRVGEDLRRSPSTAGAAGPPAAGHQPDLAGDAAGAAHDGELAAVRRPCGLPQEGIGAVRLQQATRVGSVSVGDGQLRSLRTRCAAGTPARARRATSRHHRRAESSRERRRRAPARSGSPVPRPLNGGEYAIRSPSGENRGPPSLAPSFVSWTGAPPATRRTKRSAARPHPRPRNRASCHPARSPGRYTGVSDATASVSCPCFAARCQTDSRVRGSQTTAAPARATQRRGSGDPAPAMVRRGGGSADAPDGDVRLDRLQRRARLAGALITLRGILRQAALDDAAKHRRHVRGQRLRRRAQDGGGQLELVAPLERQLAGRHLEQHDAERPDVAALVARPGRAAPPAACKASVPASHARRHRVARARHRIGDVRRQPARQAEVEHLGAAFGADHDVRRLQIAMDDAARVRVRERVGDLRPVADDGLRRQTVRRDRSPRAAGPRRTPWRCTAGRRFRRPRRRCRCADDSGPTRRAPLRRCAARSAADATVSRPTSLMATVRCSFSSWAR